jgi:Protein of unknwon function (DUF3310)
VTHAAEDCSERINVTSWNDSFDTYIHGDCGMVKANPDEWECGDCGAWVNGDWCNSCGDMNEPTREAAALAKLKVSRSRSADAAKLQQVGGDHYVKYAIQPFDIIDCYGLNFYAGNALKYLLRYRDKGGVEDLKKARHYVDKLIEVTDE